MLQYLLLVLITALKDGYSLEVQEWIVVDFEYQFGAMLQTS